MNRSKSWLFLFFVLILGFQSLAQDQFSTYYYQRQTQFAVLPKTDGEIIFLGNSITDGGNWSELFKNLKAKNRGISGDITDGIQYRLDEVIRKRPSKVFMLIGTNDLARGVHPDTVIAQILSISSRIKKNSPQTKLYVQSILPVNDTFDKFQGHTSKGDHILKVNDALRRSARFYDFTFIDLHSQFKDETGKMNPKYTNDGLHLLGEGYLFWQQLIYPYVYDLEEKPALIPMPQNVSWGEGLFSLTHLKNIVIKDEALLAEAEKLKQIIEDLGWSADISKQAYGNSIELVLGEVATPQYRDEAYKISVGDAKITVEANALHGIFNGIQTLRQLMRNGYSIPAVEIIDWPAFSWRGYMVDAGRNYMPMDLLKQHIEVMAQYKYNIFHFHFTEDIAWRLASKKYPQLTDPETMLRNRGQFYSENDMRELIAFCEARHITLVPEIDMPGHSAAFKRAMGVDMQSDEGLKIVKDILEEFFETYDLEYIHIGADEVKIVKKDFLPEVIKLIRLYNKKIIGWEPGGNFTDDVIRQMWMESAVELAKNKNVKLIDSRHLYLNHMDPLEAVTTLFFRKIGNQINGSENMLGGTLCTWPDRRIERPEDVLTTNPVYPGMLAFAERSWQGGGEEGWTAVIGANQSDRVKQFAAFENRLLDHKTQYFSDKPFPYVGQSDTEWTFYGPYDNKGDLAKIFEPESSGFNVIPANEAFKSVGGTMVLRHWWAPLIDGLIESPKENTTYYAHTRIWAEMPVEKAFWIGFNNLSRSPNPDSPPAGAWDDKKSKVWVNGEEIMPPIWKRGGMKGHSEVPLIDEGYEFRKPTIINLKRGWNDVWIKAPVGSFQGPDWHNPVKWMFTFVEADD